MTPAYEWLVVSGPKAQTRGAINGNGDYGFLLTVNDGQQTGGGIDKFRIKVRERSTGDVVDDNHVGAADGDAATDAIEGGSIVIHNGGKT